MTANEFGNEPMNPEVKEKWVRALRSGEFQQGKGALQDTGGRFCCLGVLCELAYREGVVDRRVASGTFSYADTEGDSSTMQLTQGVREWAGLSLVSPVVRGVECATPTSWRDQQGRPVYLLTQLNDSQEGLSFAEIADIIEEQL